ncbi:pyridoxamine 5'-phosphate oxidase [Oceanicella actignis]|uniref:Pyridoxine/pyridoxamine 5'-phosphate oxidase n=1 Tax=Oceanicella actignis TaxID=1189325 RepID=A0A1M7S1D4_9RHOB|nr:pyridoxamine 5'-phosphate oxidase [Oceanicella actignis]TYO90140.1 pyridoxamine 5'-phosphate oxidase [Oceanicella actignis]SES91832.1 Pyridoxamine 5'-phosphate oxidase [Oceanicella actignis]SHN52323.1 Pyridoxamine 5'-phosphate oxidase [Oceanicella actignis]
MTQPPRIIETEPRGGIFAGDDPFALAAAWLAEAERTEPNDPNAMALATADPDGMPDVRMVLLKEIEPAAEGGAFLFYTNYGSAKGRQLAANPRAAFVIHWKTLRRQIRARGLVEREEGPKADAYFASRSLASRVGAWASRQSEPLSSRAHLMAEAAKAGARFMGAPPRPPFWGGFRIRPLQIEFWADGAHRLHDRFRWTRQDPLSQEWTVTRLNP